MAGPARVAWFILAELLALVPFIPVQAASPRDAVKLMPELTHSSEFQFLDSEGQNKYFDTWDVDWSPPPLQFSNSTSAFTTMHYQVKLSDMLNRTGGTSSGGRLDYLHFSLGADAQHSLSALYTLDQTDTYSPGAPPGPSTTWVSTRDDNAYVTWTPLGPTPQVKVHYSRHGTFSPPDTRSETETFGAYADYTPLTGAFGQHYAVTTETSRSLNYSGGAPTNTDRLEMDGYRDIPMGALGHLLLGYRYDETASDYQQSLNTVRSYDGSLGWSGVVSNMPLSYYFGYVNHGDTSGAGNTWQVRDLELTFAPPVPAGKSASMKLTDLVTQTSSNPGLLPATSSTDEQTAAWSFQANPRVGGWLTYDARSTTDMVAHLRSDDNQQMAGSLWYQIPGNRGSYAINMSQTFTRSPIQGLASVDSASLTTLFNLGRRADLSLVLNQYSADNRDSPLAVATTNSTFISRVNYNLRPGLGRWDQGLTLNAMWEQRNNRASQGSSAAISEGSTQTYNVTLNYVTPANWQYTLVLQAKDISDTTGGIASYSTNNDIWVTIRYAF